MEAVQYIKELKEFSKEVESNDDRELINISKEVKDGYSYGFAINMINNEYEVYMFVANDNGEDIVASNLLYVRFKYLDQAKEYQKELINKYKDIEVSELANVIK